MFNREKPGEPLRREVGGDAARIQACPGRGNRLAINIGGEHLHLIAPLQYRHAFLQQDGEGIGFFAGGAAYRPYPDRGALRFAVEKFGNNLFLELFECLRIAEETGHPDEQVAQQRLHLRRLLL